MQIQTTPAALAAVAFLCAACSKAPVDPPAAAPPVAVVAPGSTQAPTSDTSVPSAQSVLSPASGAAKPAVDATRTNDKMSRAEESTAMPMAGQANDHSAPLPAKRASAP
jgi:hypothetical protein